MLEKPEVTAPNVGAGAVDTESTADEFSKGLPKRGARKVLFVIVGVAVVAAIFFTTNDAPKKIVPKEAITRPEPVNVAKQLKADAESQQSVKPVQKPGPPPVANSENVASEGKLSPAELERIRREKAAASPMDANEVALVLNRNFSQDGGSNSEEKAAEEIAALRRTSLDALTRSNGKGQAAQGRRLDRDEAFLATAKDASIDEFSAVQPPKNELALAPGSIIRLALMRGINTDSPGQITAQVVSNVYDSMSGRKLLIPMGARVIGIYSSEFATGQRRVVMAMTRMDLPNGNRIALSGSPAADQQGYSGLPADVNNHFVSMFGTSLLVGASSLLLPKEDRVTTSTTTPTGTQNAGSILSNSLASVIQTLAERNKLTKPTATIEPGTAFSFSTTKELLLKEYR